MAPELDSYSTSADNSVDGVVTQSSQQIAASVKSRPSLRRGLKRALAGNIFYTGCQGLMTIALARLGPPDLLGTFGLGIAVAAPVVEFASLHLKVVESVDVDQKHSFYDYFALQSVTSTLAMVVVAGLALLGPFRGEAAFTILACGLAKVIEAAGFICHGKMQQAERTDLLANSLAWRGVASLLAIVVGVWLSGRVSIGVLAMALAWLVVLVCYDLPHARALQAPRSSNGRPRWRAMGSIAWTALPLGLFVGMNSLLTNAPRYFVEGELGPRDLGIFSALAYLGLAARAFYMSFLNAVLARLADHYLEGETSQFLAIISKATIFIVTLGLASCMATILLGDWILLLFGADYQGNQVVLTVLTAAMAVKTMWMLFVSALYAMRRFRLILLLQAPGGMLLFGLLWSTVGRFGLHGAAWSVLAASLVDVGLFASVVLVSLHRRRDSKSLPA